MQATPERNEIQRLVCDRCSAPYAGCTCDPEDWIGTKKERAERVKQIHRYKVQAAKETEKARLELQKPRERERIAVRLSAATIEQLCALGRRQGHALEPHRTGSDFQDGCDLALGCNHGTPSQDFFPEEGKRERVSVLVDVSPWSRGLRVRARIKKTSVAEELRAELLRGLSMAWENYRKTAL